MLEKEGMLKIDRYPIGLQTLPMWLLQCLTSNSFNVLYTLFVPVLHGSLWQCKKYNFTRGLQLSAYNKKASQP